MNSSHSTAWSLEKAAFYCHGGLVPQPSIQGFAALLHECSKEGNPRIGLQLHRYMCKYGLDTHGSLAKLLVSMLVKLGKPQDALLLYQRLHNDSTAHLCDDHCFVSLVKACAKLKDMERGIEIHVEVSRLGLPETNFIIGSALVDLYAKCGLLDKARQVFNKLLTRNVVSWTTLITGYTEHGDGEEALNCFERMLHDGVSPNAVTFVCSLKACATIRDGLRGQEIHAEILKLGLLQDIVVGNALVDMYAKCGLLGTACYLFGKLPKRDIVSWTSLIGGYIEHGQGEEALKHYKAMRLQRVYPDAFMFVCALRACGSIQAVIEGGEIHDEIERQGLLEGNFFVASALVDMYAKCGLLEKAQKVLDGLQVRNCLSWNALITGYTEQGRAEEVLELFERMQDEGFSPNSTTFACCLKACGDLGHVDKGQEMHLEIERQGLDHDPLIGNAVVDMYVKCGVFLVGEDLFDHLPLRDVISWNALITGYVDHGHCEKALEGFEQMRIEGVSQDSITYICALRACGQIGVSDKGREIHCEVSRQGILEDDAMVGNAVLDMYVKCNLLSRAQDVFNELPIKSAVSWNTLIAGLADSGRGEEALDYHEEMLLEGLLPDVVTLVCILSGCGSIGEIEKGREMHAEIERRGLLGEEEAVVGNALIDMYAKCGLLIDARKVFDKLLGRDVVSCNILLAAYVEHGHGEDALNLLEDMQRNGVSAAATTLVWGLTACADVGATGKGGEFHAEAERQGLLENNVVVGNALISMYASCGWLAMAQEVFDKLPMRNVVSQTALMAGYAQSGHSIKVFDMYNQMLGEGINPDPITFTVLLNACGRNGTYDQSQTFFDAMSKDYGIAPSVEHHCCVIDLLGRAGELDCALSTMTNMPPTPSLEEWQMMLNACTTLGHVELGKHAFYQLTDVVEGIQSTTMSNW